MIYPWGKSAKFFNKKYQYKKGDQLFHSYANIVLYENKITIFIQDRNLGFTENWVGNFKIENGEFKANFTMIENNLPVGTSDLSGKISTEGQLLILDGSWVVKQSSGTWKFHNPFK